MTGYMTVDGYSAPTVLLPIHLLSSYQVCSGAKITWALLATHANKDGATPPMPKKYLAEMLGLSIATVHQHCRELTASGWLELVRNWEPDGGSGPSSYILYMGS